MKCISRFACKSFNGDAADKIKFDCQFHFLSNTVYSEEIVENLELKTEEKKIEYEKCLYLSICFIISLQFENKMCMYALFRFM